MLSFQQKLDLFSSFPELTRNDVSMGRVNFHFEGSQHEKKTVVFRLHPNGGGYNMGVSFADTRPMTRASSAFAIWTRRSFAS